MLSRYDSCFALIFDKIFGTLINFEATWKFELLNDFMHDILILWIGGNYILIHGVANHGYINIVKVLCLFYRCTGNGWCSQ